MTWYRLEMEFEFEADGDEEAAAFAYKLAERQPYDGVDAKPLELWQDPTSDEDAYDGDEDVEPRLVREF